MKKEEEREGAKHFNYLAAKKIAKLRALPVHKPGIYDVNDILLDKLRNLVSIGIKKSARRDALKILTTINVSPKTVMEFLFFAESDNWNLACTCLDFAKDTKGKPIVTKSFKPR